MGRRPQKLELTWFNKDQALIPTEEGKYGYTWVDPKDPRYCETHTLVTEDVVRGEQAPKQDGITYSERADLEPTEDNLLILGESGDVLEALTRVPELADKYVGQVKCIYIDPPFNTAQTFANYEDNLEHSIWLTMMRGRLIHLRQLLSDDGSIWVHLDDVENHRMRMLLDEVFGAGNFVAEVIWQKAYSPKNDAPAFSVDQDYILVYSLTSDWRSNRFERLASRDALYRSTDGDPREWISADPAAPSAHRNQTWVYAIQNPFTGDLVYPAKGRCWGQNQDAMRAAMEEWGVPYRYEVIADDERRAQICGVSVDELRKNVPALLVDVELDVSGKIAQRRYDEGSWPEFYFTRGGLGGIKRKRYLDAVSSSRAPRTLWLNDEVGHSRSAKHEMNLIFPDESPFSTPKPERLLERIIHVSTNPGDIVLDIFAGSGTTAAVAHKMGRRWVTCELVEDTMERFTRPRLTKIVRGEDPGGITLTKGERVDATEKGLPEGMSAEDAQKLTSLLNKAITDRDDLKKNPAIKELKALVKTTKSKDTVNWRGGGSFTVARLSPSCFDYDPELDLVTLTEAATGQILVESVAANLNFRLTANHRYFHGVRGVMRLVVVEGRLDRSKADDLIAHLADDEGLTIAATEIDDGVRQYLRGLGRGCRAIHVPSEIFPYSSAKER